MCGMSLIVTARLLTSGRLEQAMILILAVGSGARSCWRHCNRESSVAHVLALNSWTVDLPMVRGKGRCNGDCRREGVKDEGPSNARCLAA